MYVYDRRGLAVRLVYLTIALVWWLVTAGGRLSRACVITLCYHGVTADQKERFTKQMALISSRAISCDQIYLQGKAIADRPQVCITFDDAFANLLDNAIPTTCSLGIPVTVFAVTQNMGSAPLWKTASDLPDANEITMTQEQLVRASPNALCTIASHSATHPRLTELAEDAAKRELIQSKVDLEKLLGVNVYDFAFPYGACNEKLLRTAFECDYRRVFTLGPVAVDKSEDQQVIARMKMTPDVWPIEFLLTVTGAYAWLYSLRQFCNGLLRRPSDHAVAPVYESQVPRT